MVVDRVEIDGDAQRRSDLVLTTVTAADGTGLVVVDHPLVLTQVGGQIVGDGLQLGLLAQRQHGGLDRSKTRVETQHGALVDAALGVGASSTRRRQRGTPSGTGQAGGRLDDVRHDSRRWPG